MKVKIRERDEGFVGMREAPKGRYGCEGTMRKERKHRKCQGDRRIAERN